VGERGRDTEAKRDLVGAGQVRLLHPCLLMLIDAVVIAGECGDNEESGLMSGWRGIAMGMARSKLLHRPEPSSIVPSMNTKCWR
jgi:hypothetical protein